MILGNSKTAWYSAGLHFECLHCGRCCAGPEMGYIWVSRPEIRLIADFLKMPVKELKQKFLRRVGFRMTIVEDPHTRDCVFLQQTNQGRGCAIYDVRPAQCRSWPFWESNLVSPDTWNSTARACPGINRGRLHSSEQIRDKKKNKKWPALHSNSDEDRSSIQSDKISSVSPNVGNEPLRRMVMNQNDQIIARVSEIYNWIEQRQLANKEIAGCCDACGKCCDFEQYDHRLYVTTPEIIYFVEKIGIVNIKQMVGGRCCYQIDGKCSIHAYRFSSCRIFCCKGDATFQSELTESAIKKFKALCAELQIPYRYIELPAALKSVVTAEDAQTTL